jgi:uncharacterized coiled-coil protein SlyX
MKLDQERRDTVEAAVVESRDGTALLRQQVEGMAEQVRAMQSDRAQLLEKMDSDRDALLRAIAALTPPPDQVASSK